MCASFYSLHASGDLLDQVQLVLLGVAQPEKSRTADLNQHRSNSTALTVPHMRSVQEDSTSSMAYKVRSCTK